MTRKERSERCSAHLYSCSEKKEKHVHMATTNIKLATFGAGCFWSTERCFRKEFGTKLVSAVVGYMVDGHLADEEEIWSGQANHVEVLQISFDPINMAYKDLVCFFFRMHDPTMSNKSRASTQYRSMIFTHTNDQQETAEQIRNELPNIEQITTQIQPINSWKFHIAESKHQNYLDKKYGWLIRS